MDKHEEIAVIENALAELVAMREIVLALQAESLGRLAEINALLEQLNK